MMKYILASASPRRKELLSQAGFAFETVPSQVNEIIRKKSPHAIVKDLSFQKAWDVYQKLTPVGKTVIGADTIVVYRGEILGKPAGEEEALDMLSLLAGRTHQVYTGVTLVFSHGGAPVIRSFYEKTDVTFYPIDRADLLAYADSKDPLDKAGAYGIQGPFAIHVKKIHGDYNNVVGLPIARLYQELKTFPD
ncbi:Maf family protein [Merdimonas faecis]|uniref:Maf family protein n=1 Tax=Merdimonas faecis TaxID=1653435 RepID=UPI00159F2F22|nr:Maf family protein [Merdimonas faecis]